MIALWAFSCSQVYRTLPLNKNPSSQHLLNIEQHAQDRRHRTDRHGFCQWKVVLLLSAVFTLSKVDVHRNEMRVSNRGANIKYFRLSFTQYATWLTFHSDYVVTDGMKEKGLTGPGLYGYEYSLNKYNLAVPGHFVSWLAPGRNDPITTLPGKIERLSSIHSSLKRS